MVKTSHKDQVENWKDYVGNHTGCRGRKMARLGGKKKKKCSSLWLGGKDIAIVTASTWVITVAWIIAVAQV